MSIQVGDTVGEYEVLERLGSGGVGRVYKVRHRITGRLEAMKVLLPDHEENPEQTERFLREVKLQARLSHPNIAGVLNAFRDGPNLVMIQELVAGESLASLIAARPLGLELALDYASQALAALAFAHDHGVIHRDVKPENMIVTPDGLLKVTDFGLAKTAADERLTESGTPVGSLYYMSPEQVKGSAPVDGRTDIYAMGGVLYELSTGKRPFDGEHSFAFMLAHLEQAPRPPIELDSGIPERLNNAILRSMEKKPEDRFASAAEMRREIEAVRRTMATDSLSQTSPWPAPPTTPTESKRPRWAFVGIAAALALLAVVIWMRPGSTTPEAPEPEDSASGAAVSSEEVAEEAQSGPESPTSSKPTPLTTDPTAETEPAPDTQVAAGPDAAPPALPKIITVRTNSSFGSDSRPGETIDGRIVSPARFAGLAVSGRVVEGKSSGKERGQSTVKFTFHVLYRPGGAVPIQSKTVALRNAAGREGVDESGSETKHKAGALKRIGSSIGGLFGGNKNDGGGLTNTVTARGPRIHFAEGAEFDLEVAEGSP